MTVLIPIETSSRELLYKTYLCHLLAGEGYQCYIGRKSFINELLKQFSGYIYLDKGYHTGKSESIFSIIKEQKGYIFNLDEEGGVDYGDNSTILNRYSKSLFKNVDHVFFWGSSQLRTVSDNITDKSKCSIVGHPRFDLLKRKYWFLYEDKANKYLEHYGPYILINTNMSLGNNIRGNNFVEKNYYGRINLLSKKIHFDKIKMGYVENLIYQLTALKHLKIIVRPHPEEDSSYYKMLFNKFENVKVIYDGSVIPWIIGAKVMIHTDCTTAIEALMLGRRSISCIPNNINSDLLTRLPLEASFRFENNEAIIKFINSERYSHDEVDMGDYDFLENNFSFSLASLELIVNEIKKTHVLNSIENNEIDTVTKIKIYYKNLKKMFKMNDENKLSNNKLNGLNIREINELHSLLAKHELKFAKINVAKIAQHLYKIF